MKPAMLTFAFTVIAAITAASAQPAKSVSQGAAVSVTATIEAIDSKARLVTLKDEHGVLDTIVCGPEVQRFDALKVGDKVTFRYYESLVSAITKPGAQATAQTGGVVRTGGAKPGGTLSQQLMAVVTVLAVDPKIPSITIKKADGATVSFKVEDRKNIEGVKAGDSVQITYTQALAISVQSPGK